MKHLLTVLALLSFATLQALAQPYPSLITLNDATPAIDAVVTLPPNTTGVVSLVVAQASVSVVDSANAIVFHVADPRLHVIELNFSPNKGSHTIRVERLPGMAEAYVNITPLSEMSISGIANQVDGAVASLNEEVLLPLDASSPGGTVSVSIPDGTIGVVTAIFPGASATAQLVDEQGRVVVESVGGHVDAIKLALDGGDYQLTLLGSGLTDRIVAGVRVVPADEAGVDILEMPTKPQSSVVVTAQAPASEIAAQPSACTATITSGSVNLRSGPGTGYSVLDYGYFNESYFVAGRNPQNNWLVVRTEASSAWLSRSVVNLQGVCDALAVFDIPLLESQASPLVVVRSYGNDRYDDDRYDDHHDDDDDDDDDHHDDDDDDDDDHHDNDDDDDRHKKDKKHDDD